MYPADPAQQLITAGEDLDYLSVDDLSVDNLSVAHVFWVGSRMTCMIYSAFRGWDMRQVCRSCTKSHNGS